MCTHSTSICSIVRFFPHNLFLACFLISNSRANAEKASHPKLPLETSLDVQQNHNPVTWLKPVWNWSLRFEEATNQARSFRAAIETATHIRPFHHYYTYGVAHAVSNPGVLTDDVPQKLRPGGRNPLTKYVRADVHRHQMLSGGTRYGVE